KFAAGAETHERIVMVTLRGISACLLDFASLGLHSGYSRGFRITLQAFAAETEKCVCILLGQTANLYGIGLGHGEHEILAGESTEGRPRGTAHSPAASDSWRSAGTSIPSCSAFL